MHDIGTLYTYIYMRIVTVGENATTVQNGHTFKGKRIARASQMYCVCALYNYTGIPQTVVISEFTYRPLHI